MLASKVRGASSYDLRTRAWAARWKTTSGRNSFMARITASRSRMSPRMSCTCCSRCMASKWEGLVGTQSAKPQTVAPIWLSHAASQEPLKPVWPVMNTRRPL